VVRVSSFVVRLIQSERRATHDARRLSVHFIGADVARPSARARVAVEIERGRYRAVGGIDERRGGA